MNVSCYDIAEMVIDEGSKQFSPDLVLNLDAVRKFAGFCGIIDELAEEFNGTCISVDVDGETKELVVELTCEEIIIETKDHNLLKVSESANTVSFSKGEVDEGLLIRFKFPGVWSNAE